jgi:hypothetical protein
MGEFERSGMGLKKGVAWAIEDVFTAANFEIAVIAATHLRPDRLFRKDAFQKGFATSATDRRISIRISLFR